MQQRRLRPLLSHCSCDCTRCIHARSLVRRHAAGAFGGDAGEALGDIGDGGETVVAFVAFAEFGFVERVLAVVRIDVGRRSADRGATGGGWDGGSVPLTVGQMDRELTFCQVAFDVRQLVIGFIGTVYGAGDANGVRRRVDKCGTTQIVGGADPDAGAQCRRSAARAETIADAGQRVALFE